MFRNPRRLEHQVIVITGATSGIGLATATMAAQRGAKLVLAARNAEALHEVARDLERGGAAVAVVPVDLRDRASVTRVLETAVERFGRVDTWVNNAGQTIFGRLAEISDEDHERLMRINFWGTVYGSLVAADHLRRHGGTLVNVGSIGSDFAFPLQGVYSASKHAIRGFTDALRMELEADGAPVTITLIKPASIDTPLPHRARNYTDREPKLPPPVYRPRDVAFAILAAATSARRDIYVGGGGRLISAIATTMPRLFDKTAPLIMALQQSARPPRDPTGALHETRSDGEERGDHPGFVNPISTYTRAAVALPKAAVALVAVGALSLAFLTRRA